MQVTDRGMMSGSYQHELRPVVSVLLDSARGPGPLPCKENESVVVWKKLKNVNGGKVSVCCNFVGHDRSSNRPLEHTYLVLESNISFYCGREYLFDQYQNRSNHTIQMDPRRKETWIEVNSAGTPWGRWALVIPTTLVRMFCHAGCRMRELPSALL